MMSKTRILITGGAGFIGTHLCRQLAAKGMDVAVLDIKAPNEAIAKINYHLGDILDDALLFSLLEECDQVVHLAAVVSVPLCNLDPVESYTTNFIGTVKIVEAISRINRTRPSEKKITLHFASSAAVYGQEGDSGILDETRVSVAPLSHYAHQKRASEVMLALSALEVPSVSFRFFNVYGPGQDPNSPYSGVISIFSKRLKNREPIQLFGDGDQTRDFISVHDVVSGIERALELPTNLKTGQPINMCTGVSVRIRELGEVLARIHGTKIEWLPGPARSGDIRHSCGSFGFARELLKWTPKFDLETGLRDLIENK